MANKNQYSFVLYPGKATRRIAGPYDLKTCKPHYEINVEIIEHLRSHIEVTQVLVGNEDNCQWAWKLKNNSVHPAFITITKDGVMM